MSAGLRGLASLTPDSKTSGKFKRSFESEAVVNDSDYLWGQTTFRGTRTLASTLFEYLTEGKTIDDFIADFPTDREKVVRLLMEIRESLTPFSTPFKQANSQHWRASIAEGLMMIGWLLANTKGGQLAALRFNRLRLHSAYGTRTRALRLERAAC